MTEAIEELWDMGWTGLIDTGGRVEPRVTT